MWVLSVRECDSATLHVGNQALLEVHRRCHPARHLFDTPAAGWMEDALLCLHVRRADIVDVLCFFRGGLIFVSDMIFLFVVGFSTNDGWSFSALELQSVQLADGIADD
jgi:hypothetical protein